MPSCVCGYRRAPINPASESEGKGRERKARESESWEESLAPSMLEDSLITLIPCPGAMCCPLGSLYVALILDTIGLAVFLKTALLSALQLYSLDSHSVAFNQHMIALGGSLLAAVVQSVVLFCLCRGLLTRRPAFLLPFAFWKGIWCLGLVGFAVALFFEEQLALFPKLKYALGSTEAEDLFYMLNRRRDMSLEDYRNRVLLPLTLLGALLDLWAFVVTLRAQGPLAEKGGRYRETGDEEIVYRHYEDPRAPLNQDRNKGRQLPPPPYNPHFDNVY